MDFKKVLIETSERRVRKAPSISALSLLKKELSGSQSEALAIDSLLEEVLRKNGDNLFDNNLISLVRQYNCIDISGNLRRKIRAPSPPPELAIICHLCNTLFISLSPLPSTPLEIGELGIFGK